MWGIDGRREIASRHGPLQDGRDDAALGAGEGDPKAVRQARVATQVRQQPRKRMLRSGRRQPGEDPPGEQAHVRWQRPLIGGRVDRFVMDNEREHHLGLRRPAAVDRPLPDLRGARDLLDR